MASEQQTSNTPEEERDLWRTPGWLFRFLEHRYGRFNVDLAADAKNHLHPVYLTLSDDALTYDWCKLGNNGYCNPPYSDPLPWVRCAVAYADERDFSTTLVLPSHRGQEWAALSKYATERIDFEGRVNFNRPDGSPGPSPRTGTVVFYFRANDLGTTRVTWANVLQLKKRWS